VSLGTEVDGLEVFAGRGSEARRVFFVSLAAVFFPDMSTSLGGAEDGAEGGGEGLAVGLSEGSELLEDKGAFDGGEHWLDDGGSEKARCPPQKPNPTGFRTEEPPEGGR